MVAQHRQQLDQFAGQTQIPISDLTRASLDFRQRLRRNVSRKGLKLVMNCRNYPVLIRGPQQVVPIESLF